MTDFRMLVLNWMLDFGFGFGFYWFLVFPGIGFRIRAINHLTIQTYAAAKDVAIAELPDYSASRITVACRK